MNFLKKCVLKITIPTHIFLFGINLICASRNSVFLTCLGWVLLKTELWLYRWRGGQLSASLLFKLFNRQICFYWCKKTLLTRTNFHPVGSHVLKGCDLVCYIKSSLFSVSASAAQAPLPLIWHLVFRLVINRSLCALQAPETLVSGMWMAAWMESVRAVCTGVCTWLDEEREGMRVWAFVHIPPRDPHFLGILSPASALYDFAPEASTCTQKSVV